MYVCMDLERVCRPGAGSSQLPLHMQRHRDEMGLPPRTGRAAVAGDQSPTLVSYAH